jgi:two-component system osmolarity sensor histidine kinase EnvZ
VPRPGTLYAKTGLTLSVALAAFLLFSVGVMVYYILVPVAKRGADDLAALIVLSAKTWVELPPETRGDFEWELLDNHDLMLASADVELPLLQRPMPYIRFLEAALTRRAGAAVHIHVSQEADRWYWVDLPMAGQIIRIGFARSRIGGRPPVVIVLLVSAGMVVILVTSLALVRRLTRPLARLSAATSSIGRGELLDPLPETGPLELASLARDFNRMAREISELLANRTTLLAGISHDLRTPMTRMRLALEILSDDAAPELVDGLNRDLEEMDRLIGQSLELARGLEQRKSEPVDLDAFVENIVNDYRRGGLVIDWESSGPCRCQVASLALRRIVANLLDNAVRYGGEQPVEIRLHCGATDAAIRILDRGSGIPPEQSEAVFRPFCRLESSRSRATGGSGLGLAIARQLADARGWQIQLLPRDGGGIEARITISRQSS